MSPNREAVRQDVVEKRSNPARDCLYGVAGGSCVRGLSFVDPHLMAKPGSVAADGGEAARLLETCRTLNLDFSFVPSWRSWSAEAARQLDSAGVAVFAVVPGVAWPALEDLGPTAALRAAANTPNELIGAMDAALVIAADAADAALSAGAAALVIADDFASAQAPLLPLAFLREHLFPRLVVLTRIAREAGIPAVLHCDGAVHSLLPDVGAAGFAAVHGDFGACTGTGRLAEALDAARGANLAMIGGIPTSSLGDDAEALRAGAWAGRAASRGHLLVSDDGGVSTPGEFRRLEMALRAACS